MLEKISSKHSFTELLEIDGLAIAIADKNQKFIWYNKSFKSYIGLKKIKGKNIFDLFELNPPANFENLRSSRPLNIPLPHFSKILSVKIIKKKERIEGYLIYIRDIPRNISLPQPDNTGLVQMDSIFQKDLKEILAILPKENSIKLITEEILSRSVNISRSNFGFTAFIDDNKKVEFLSYDPKDTIKNKPDAEKEIKSNFSFISKWFEVNHKSLVALNIPNNIGFNLAQSLQINALIISPCFISEKLIAALILGKKEKNYSPVEISEVEQFATLLSFSINKIRTEELNLTLEKNLRQTQKLETIGKLTSGMAHDFNNLLSSIFGSLNLLKKRVPDSENVVRLIDNIESCAVRAKDLTKGLLSYGKPTPLKKEIIKPNQLLTEISKVITQTFPSNINFEKKVDDNLYDLLGNPTEIYQVLLNLAVNAKEAIEKEGTIKLAAQNLVVNEKNLISYPMLEKFKYVKFSITDTGSGIKEENIQHIFDPYFSTKVKETGSGLGLYVTYGIIKTHRGHIEVSSEINKGTTFDVYIPAFEPETEIEIADASEKIILLADDEIMLRDLLAELLESNGYNVIKVSSGIEVLKVLTEEIKVDLVIIDYNMPEMNGLECIDEIRKLNFKMPVILSSGSLPPEEEEMKARGINGMVSKPYEFDTMLLTIQKLI
jgi:signal transduction histidine kinase/CheY-like chemotaxis protein